MSEYLRIEAVLSEGFPEVLLSVLAASCVHEGICFENSEQLSRRVLQDRYSPEALAMIRAWIIPCWARSSTQVRAHAKPVINMVKNPEAAFELCRTYARMREDDGSIFMQMERYDSDGSKLYGVGFAQANAVSGETEIVAETWGPAHAMGRLACAMLASLFSDNGYVEFPGIIGQESA